MKETCSVFGRGNYLILFTMTISISTILLKTAQLEGEFVMFPFLQLKTYREDGRFFAQAEKHSKVHSPINTMYGKRNAKLTWKSDL